MTVIQMSRSEEMSLDRTAVKDRHIGYQTAENRRVKEVYRESKTEEF